MIITSPLFSIPASSKLTDEDKEHIKVIRKIILEMYPFYPTLNNFKSFFQLRLVCRKFHIAFKSFYPYEIPTNRKWNRTLQNELMSCMDLRFALEKGKYEDALVRAKVMDLPNSNFQGALEKNNIKQQLHSKLIRMKYTQRFLIERMGFEGALNFTLNLDKQIQDEQTHQLALSAYIYQGCALCSFLPNLSIKGLYELENHPFMQALIKSAPLSNLTSSAAEYFLQNIINRALGINSFDMDTVSIHSSEEEAPAEEETPPLKQDPEYEEKREIARQWLSIIPSKLSLGQLIGGEDLIKFFDLSGS